MSGTRTVHLLDYGAGNVRSLRNALLKLDYDVVAIENEKDFDEAQVLIFPGVGAFGCAISALEQKGFIEPLKKYILAGRPFLGICIGLQILFESSSESPNVKGLGIIPGKVEKFSFRNFVYADDEETPYLSVPHMGWNRIESSMDKEAVTPLMYFVHSYRAIPSPENADWILTKTSYGSEFISAIAKGRVVAAQFHPEKSGEFGLQFIDNFVQGRELLSFSGLEKGSGPGSSLTKRIIACLDVRSNDDGDLVVTKGDQYDVREKDSKAVRNMGKPVALGKKYYDDGADELVFLNITSFRTSPLHDTPMLHLLEKVSQEVFVPLTIGGGIRDYTDETGKSWSALDVASAYFRAGADKISLGSDAVFAAEEYYANGCNPTGASSLEQISRVYGKQAVVVSIDPKRVYVHDPPLELNRYVVQKPHQPGPNGEQLCWYQCTVSGGREARNIDAVAVAIACEALGAGEILLNCIDTDGQNSGFDLELVQAVKESVGIPVIASSGAGCPKHFLDLFSETDCDAGLAAGMFHRNEYTVKDVKSYLSLRDGMSVRL